MNLLSYRPSRGSPARIARCSKFSPPTRLGRHGTLVSRNQVPMFLSVIICTRNRAASLQRTVATILCSGNLAEPDWELLVVDNASVDGTARTCTELQSRFPRHFRFLTEKKIGKSHALNTALA